MAETRGCSWKVLIIILGLGFVGLSARPVLANPSSDPGMEQLLFQEIPSVFTASKYEQPVTAAPSAVSIVTAAEIRKYGYRTLADILRSLSGFYTSFDRQSASLGVRGFGRPGDANDRILVLLDGARINNNIFDGAGIDNDFPLDVDLIDRVEIVRGPGSSLYGSNAFFAVINIISRRGRDLQGLELSASGASQKTYRGRGSYGTRLPGGLEMLVSGTRYDSRGHKRLYFPEYDTPETNNGVAEGVNHEDAYQFFGRFSLGDFSLETSWADLNRQIPTGAFGTAFNDPRNRAGGHQGLAQLQYRHLFADQLEVTARLLYSRFRSHGDYVYDYGAPGSPQLVVNRDDFQGDWWGTELQIGKTLQHHRLVAGGEYHDNFRQDLENHDVVSYLDSRNHSQTVGFFLQDDYQMFPNLALSLGVRYDHFSTCGGETSPRLALIYNPWEKTALKLLYGKAFRAPSAYESYYNDELATQKPNPDLGPETIRSWEVVWEQFFNDHLRAVASGYYYRIKDLVNLTLDPSDELLVFRNLDKVKASGMELELEGRLASGWEGRLSYALQNAENSQTGESLSNSPRQLFKLCLIAPLVTDKASLAVEEQYTDRRRTVSGGEAGSFAVTNLTLSARHLLPGLEVALSVYNLLDRRYADPVSAALLQDSVVQDGRSFRGKLTYSF